MPHTYARASARSTQCARASMHAFRHDVILSLERTGRVNDYVRSAPPQFRGEIRGASIERGRLRRRAHCIGYRPRLLRITAGDDYAVIAIGRERSDDESAEVAVTTENDCTAHLTTMGPARPAIPCSARAGRCLRCARGHRTSSVRLRSSRTLHSRQTMQRAAAGTGISRP